jgi:hypothetical protein
MGKNIWMKIGERVEKQLRIEGLRNIIVSTLFLDSKVIPNANEHDIKTLV